MMLRAEFPVQRNSTLYGVVIVGFSNRLDEVAGYIDSGRVRGVKLMWTPFVIEREPSEGGRHETSRRVVTWIRRGDDCSSIGCRGVGSGGGIGAGRPASDRTAAPTDARDDRFDGD
jgi:hypothetical protein